MIKWKVTGYSKTWVSELDRKRQTWGKVTIPLFADNLPEAFEKGRKALERTCKQWGHSPGFPAKYEFFISGVEIDQDIEKAARHAKLEEETGKSPEPF